MKQFTCDKTGLILFVSVDGKIYKNGKQMTIWNNGGGYPSIQLYKNGIRRSHTIHRLLALNYIDNPLNLPDVNHIDGNKENYSLKNLEWCTKSQNMKHAVDTGLMTNCCKKGDEHNTSKHKFEKVKEIRLKYETGLYSMRKLAKEFNTSSGYISDVVNNKIRINE